jgi:hypothetical protein
LGFPEHKVVEIVEIKEDKDGQSEV